MINQTLKINIQNKEALWNLIKISMIQKIIQKQNQLHSLRITINHFIFNKKYYHFTTRNNYHNMKVKN